MILQSLVRLYEDLADRGEIPRSGWSPAKISYALCIDEEGRLQQVIPQMHEEQRGKKSVLRPNLVDLPAAVKRTSGVSPNFLWDNASYILGFRGWDKKDKVPEPENGIISSEKQFKACGELHHQLLDGVHTPAAEAVLRFFDTWDFSDDENQFRLADALEDLKKGCNLMFRINGVFAQEDPQIRQAWQNIYDDPTGVRMQCLVTGKMDYIASIHPIIKNVAGTKQGQGNIVSFNEEAYCSYGKKQSYNAPVGKYAAFAYTSALNYLLADRKNVQYIGDTTVVCWAEGAEPQYPMFSAAALFGGTPPQGLTDSDLRSMVKRLAEGLPCRELELDPDRPFYVLGLAPNTARISVRFFLRDSFGKIMQNINAHHERMEIVDQQYPYMPLWALLRETVRPQKDNKSKPDPPSPAMSGAVARAIFSGTPYPASLLEAVTLRIRAEREITPEKAAIIKAYYLKNSSSQCPKEVLTVSLNENSTNIPYVLGRLFFVYEDIQKRVSPNLNATIKDKYFNAASSTPATIFPILDNLSQKHLRKMDAGIRIYYERQIMDLKDRLGESYPLRLTLPEQGSFNLGYYHQCKARYTKKEDK